MTAAARARPLSLLAECALVRWLCGEGDCGSKIQPAKGLAFGRALLYSGRRTGGRVVDGTALEMRRACKGSVGSNPTLSAKFWPSMLKYHRDF